MITPRSFIVKYVFQGSGREMVVAWAQMIATLERSRIQTALQGLERFATENPDSLYGHWAATVIREFRESGTIVDPSAESPQAAPEGFGGFP